MLSVKLYEENRSGTQLSQANYRKCKNPGAKRQENYQDHFDIIRWISLQGNYFKWSLRTCVICHGGYKMRTIRNYNLKEALIKSQKDYILILPEKNHCTLNHQIFPYVNWRVKSLLIKAGIQTCSRETAFIGQRLVPTEFR